MEGCGGDTDIRGNAADVYVGHPLLLDDVLQARLGQLHVVEEGRVRIHIWITTLVNHLGFRVNLEEGCFVQIGQKRKTIEDLQILV